VANPRLRALSRLLLISHLENLIQLEAYEKAEKEIRELNKWEPSEGALWSPMELSVNFKKWSTVSKIYQSRGRLESAKSHLVRCYSFLRPERLRNDTELLPDPDPNRFQIICRLSDLLCADGYWVDARSNIEYEINSISSDFPGKFAKALTRLKVSLLDVDIAESKYDQASSGIEWLKQQFVEISSPDISYQWLHVRSIIASARLLHSQRRFKEAISEWDLVLSLVRKYSDSFEPEGFFYGLAQLSIALARLQNARSTTDASCISSPSWHADTRQFFDKACAVLAREDVNYWVPTLPKTVIPDLLSNIQPTEASWWTADDFLKLQQKYPYLPVFDKRHQRLSSRM
jgi:tetratricopeptide (TPR) repeat protein